MRNRLLLILVAAFLGLLMVPVLITQLDRPEPRSRPQLDLQDLTHEEVRYSNAVGGIDLAEMLFLPEHGGPYPAVVVIH
jgi:hypothetical protein